MVYNFIRENWAFIFLKLFLLYWLFYLFEDSWFILSDWSAVIRNSSNYYDTNIVHLLEPIRLILQRFCYITGLDSLEIYLFYQLIFSIVFLIILSGLAWYEKFILFFFSIISINTALNVYRHYLALSLFYIGWRKMSMLTHISILPLAAFLITDKTNRMRFMGHVVLVVTVISLVLALKFNLLHILQRSVEEVDFVVKRKVGWNVNYFLAIWTPLIMIGLKYRNVMWLAFYTAILWLFIGDIPTSERFFVPLEVLPIYFLSSLSGVHRRLLLILITVQGLAVFNTYSL